MRKGFSFGYQTIMRYLLAHDSSRVLCGAGKERRRMCIGQSSHECLVEFGINWGLTNKLNPPGPCDMISGMAVVAAAAAAVVAPTVGGGDGLPSESSTLASVRSSSCCRRNARSSLARWMPRRDRCIRRTSTSLESSISRIRFLSSRHFWRYEFSTEVGKAGAGPSGDFARKLNHRSVGLFSQTANEVN